MSGLVATLTVLVGGLVAWLVVALRQLQSLDTLHQRGRVAADRHRDVLGDERPVIEETETGTPAGWIDVKVTGFESIGANRWIYSGYRQVYAGAGEFSDAPAAALIENIYNSIESNNHEEGVQGHGANVSGSGYPPGFSVQPLAPGAVFPARRRRAPDGTIEWVVSAVNSDDGTCE